MISIAICDDELQELEKSQTLIAEYQRQHPQYDIKTCAFLAPLELLSYVSEHGSFDVMLLDVYMEGMLGIDAARELRYIGDDSEIIFLTTSKDHAIDAFEVNAAQYLAKPYKEEMLFNALDKVIQRIDVNKRGAVILKTSEGIIRLAPNDVVYTETNRNNYQTIHTIQGKILETRMTSTELFNLLSPNKYFIKCGASLNLNLKYVRQISKDKIALDTGQHLNFPYRCYPMLKENFLSFQMEN